MIVYLAGPISNDPDYKEKFGRAEKWLTEAGHSVINPSFLPNDLGNCTDYMKICFPMIDACDAIVMLDGWEKSCGACREWGYGMALDKTVLPLPVFGFQQNEFRHCTECKRLAYCDGERQYVHKQMGTPYDDFLEAAE